MGLFYWFKVANRKLIYKFTVLVWLVTDMKSNNAGAYICFPHVGNLSLEVMLKDMVSRAVIR